jgi:predicted transcriptional regulator
MPMFVKMGLNGTGYLGKQEHTSRAAKKRAKRRIVYQGYPITKKFTTIDDVRSYLSGDRIICLLCGRSFKALHMHIEQIHNVDVDTYREIYNIPWTYGLVSISTKQNYSEAVRNRINEGWEPPKKIGIAQADMIAAKRRRCCFKNEVGIKNLGEYAKPKYPLSKAPDGSMETMTKKKERETCKRGTAEFKEKMKERVQYKKGLAILKTYWKGRKQTQDHIIKRTQRNKAILP